jgi:MADS-box transcription factor
MQRNSAPQPYMTPHDQQAMQYQAYLQQQQQAQSAYPMPPQPGMHQQR